MNRENQADDRSKDLTQSGRDTFGGVVADNPDVNLTGESYTALSCFSTAITPIAISQNDAVFLPAVCQYSFRLREPRNAEYFVKTRI
jgi:hypothetical protein